MADSPDELDVTRDDKDVSKQPVFDLRPHMRFTENRLDTTAEDQDDLTAVVKKPVITRVDVELRREGFRGWITLAMVLLLGVIVAASFLLVALSPHSATGLESAVSLLLDKMFAPLIGILGTAIGFYFGGKQR